MARGRQWKTEDAHETCRTFGHAWYEANTDKHPIFGVYIALRCERCTAERLDNVDRYGNFIGRRYNYAEGYQYHRNNGEEAPNRQQWRHRWMLRHGLTDA